MEELRAAGQDMAHLTAGLEEFFSAGPGGTDDEFALLTGGTDVSGEAAEGPLEGPPAVVGTSRGRGGRRGATGRGQMAEALGRLTRSVDTMTAKVTSMDQRVSRLERSPPDPRKAAAAARGIRVPEGPQGWGPAPLGGAAASGDSRLGGPQAPDLKSPARGGDEGLPQQLAGAVFAGPVGGLGQGGFDGLIGGPPGRLRDPQAQAGGASDDWGMDGAPLAEVDNLEFGEDELEGLLLRDRALLSALAAQTSALRRTISHGGGGAHADLTPPLARPAGVGAGALGGARGTAAIEQQQRRA